MRTRPVAPPVAQASELRDYLTLPPFLRVLLITDGTVTRSLEAYFGERIDVEVLTHAEANSDRSYTELNVVTGEPVLHRCVILRGRVTQAAYAFAESVIVLACVFPDMRRKLIEDRKGIGELLLEGKLETYRELIAVRRSEAGQWAPALDIDSSASVVSRIYKICFGGRPAIRIEEVFPQSRFGSDYLT